MGSGGASVARPPLLGPPSPALPPLLLLLLVRVHSLRQQRVHCPQKDWANETRQTTAQAEAAASADVTESHEKQDGHTGPAPSTARAPSTSNQNQDNQDRVTVLTHLCNEQA
jgi:hypothetical protein